MVAKSLSPSPWTDEIYLFTLCLWAKHRAVLTSRAHRSDLVPISVLHFKRTFSFHLLLLGTQPPQGEEIQAATRAGPLPRELR